MMVVTDRGMEIMLYVLRVRVDKRLCRTRTRPNGEVETKDAVVVFNNSR